MRLDGAVFLLPTPQQKVMPTRRAFVMAGCTFAAGIAVGGACGYSAGAATSAGSAGSGELPKSGDAELDELRRLAVKAPIEELMDNSRAFVELVGETYRNDRLLWQGVGRITDALLNGYQVPDRRLASIVVAQVIEAGNKEFTQSLAPKVRALRQVK